MFPSPPPLRPAPELEGQLTCSLVCMRAQSRPALCDPMDCSPPGSSVHRISQAGILEWLPFPPPGDLPDPGIKPTSPVSPALASEFFTTVPPAALELSKRASLKGGLNPGPHSLRPVSAVPPGSPILKPLSFSGAQHPPRTSRGYGGGGGEDTRGGSGN